MPPAPINSFAADERPGSLIVVVAAAVDPPRVKPCELELDDRERSEIDLLLTFFNEVIVLCTFVEEISRVKVRSRMDIKALERWNHMRQGQILKSVVLR